MSSEIEWKPTDYYENHCNLAEFINEYSYAEYSDLIPTNKDELETIWGDFADDTGIVWREQYTDVVDVSAGDPFAEWFVDGELNAIETILDKWVTETPERPMYVRANEEGEREQISYQEMYERSNRLANALRSHGISRGDTVALTFPMHPTGFAAALSCLRIGATFTMIFPGYGADAIGLRLDDSQAKMVITADGYRRGGNEYDLLSKIDTAVDDAPSVDDVLVYPHRDITTEIQAVNDLEWNSFLEGHSGEAETAVMSSSDPAFYAYSSGTTGTPKGTIHTHASILVMGNKEAKYHFDLGEGDTLMWATDFGWIIVPIWMLAGVPALGGTTVLFEGDPMEANGDPIWRTIEECDVTTFGIAPTGARGLRQLNDSPRDTFDLSSLRTLGSTGEPWDADGWRWFLNAVGGGEVPIINASGGTELAGALLSPTPMVPLKPGTLYGPAPGVAANIYDEEGEPVDEGYLVIEQPIPGMTHGLTSGEERYLEEYWGTFDGVWNQNDWAEKDQDGFWFITGRADDTMNIAGRRITAPTIEEVITEHPAVEETAIIPVPDETRGQSPVAFVVLLDASTTDQSELADEINKQVEEGLGAPFRPKQVHVVSALPRTQTGKIPRNVLESTYLEQPLGNVSTLDNSTVLEDFPKKE